MRRKSAAYDKYLDAECILIYVFTQGNVKTT